MNRIVLILSVLAAGIMPTLHADATKNLPIAGLTISELEARRADAVSELARLAKPSLNSGVGSIGYASQSKNKPNESEWLEINLGGYAEIDEIVLIPTIRLDAGLGLISDGSPMAYRILGGTLAHPEGELLAKISKNSVSNLSILPSVIPIDPVEALWVRIEVSQLGKSKLYQVENNYALQLAEVLVFSAETNVALRRPVTASHSFDNSRNWSPGFVVDGNLPYQMDAATGQKSATMAVYIDRYHSESVVMDLREPVPISRIRIHTEDPSDTVPRDYLENNGIPEHFILEGSNDENFSEKTTLLTVQIESIDQIAPMMEWSFKENVCRYVRLSTQPESRLSGNMIDRKRISFAEIEILSHGKNVSIGKNVTATFDSPEPISPLTHIVDGRNELGDILPLRQWIGELGRRQQLEQDLPLLEAALHRRHERQKWQLDWVVRLAVALAAMMAFLLFYMRLRRQRQETRIRERIAANLHDELGANLHAIGLLGDVVEDSLDSPERVIEAVHRIRALTERTGAAARHCTNMLEAEGICENLVEEMKQDAKRFLGDLEHHFKIQDEVALNALPRRKRLDLYLFHKECLVNIIRHTRARKVTTRISFLNRRVELTVADDGCGFADGTPKSLKRRARLMGAKVLVKHPEAGGTIVHLKLNTSKLRSLL